MKKISIFVLFVFVAISTIIASEIKRPDSYNYLRGCDAILKEDYEEGMRFLKMELDENPKNGYAWAWILVVHLQKDEYGEAIDAANTSLKYLPKKDTYYNGFVHKSLARIYYNINEPEKALSEISTAIKLDTKETDYLLMRAQLYYISGCYDKAEEDYHNFIKSKPGNTEGFVGLGKNRLAQNLYDEAIEQFNYAIKLDNESSDSYVYRSKCYLGKKDYGSAAQDIIKALEIDGNDEAFKMFQTCNDTCYQNLAILIDIQSKKYSFGVNWNYYLGVLHQTHNHFREAIDRYNKSLEGGTYALIYENIAQCYSSLGNNSKALQYIDMAMEIDSTNHILILKKADYYYYSGNEVKAIEMIGKYLELEPEFAYAYYRRGFYKDNTGDVDGAIEDYTYCITIGPEYAYAFLGRGDMYMLKDNVEAAKKDYQTVLNKDTVIKETGNCRQYAYLMLGMRDSAEIYMNSILEKYPTGGNFYDASCLMSRMGEKKRSIDYLNKAFEKGYVEFKHIEMDDDMDSIRDDEEFINLIERYHNQLFENNISLPNDTSSMMELKTTEIPYSNDGNLLMIQCTINKLPLYFVLDTGASDVSISIVEANFMLKNGYLHKNDIIGKSSYLLADGSISEGTIINLRNVYFGGLELTNVKASVVKSQKAPLLLGQSVLERLGRIEINNFDKKVRVTHSIR